MLNTSEVAQANSAFSKAKLIDKTSFVGFCFFIVVGGSFCSNSDIGNGLKAASLTLTANHDNDFKFEHWAINALSKRKQTKEKSWNTIRQS